MNIRSGDNSINIGKGKKIKIKQVTASSQDKPTLTIDRRELGKIEINPSRLALVSGLTFGATCISYLGIFVKFPLTEIPSYIPNISMLIITVCSLGVIIGLTLVKRKFFHIWSNNSLETREAKIFLIRTNIECPICKSSMAIYSNQDNTYVTCKRNPNHKFEFDYTQLDNLK